MLQGWNHAKQNNNTAVNCKTSHCFIVKFAVLPVADQLGAYSLAQAAEEGHFVDDFTDAA